LLANLLLDELDKELERRRHRFVRYADDCNISVGSRHAGERVMASLKGFLEKRLKLTVNEQKSAVDRPWNRRILGFTFTRGKQYRRTVSAMALAVLKAKIRRFTQRTRGYSLEQIIRELRPALLGWPKFAPATSAFPPSMAVRKRTSATPKSSRRSLELDKWIRRKLRCYQWKQWGRAGYRRLRALGVSRELPWNTAKSAHGPWRLSRSPALAYALTHAYFTRLGLPTLA
jgi:RNA-directed DNA polymerase